MIVRHASRALAIGAACAAALFAAGCATTSAEDDPVQVRLNDVDTRLGRIERVGAGQSLVAMSQRIDALQAEVRTLRGQLEVLENGNEALRKQQRDLYADLERRLAALEGGTRGPPSSQSGTGAGGTATGGVSAEVLYGRAFDALKAGNYPAAIAGMREFLAAHPAHDLADNAQYWLGEAYYVSRDYENAIAAFTQVGLRWPDSSKAPDALLKLGYSQFELKRMAAARDTLAKVPQRYPGTDAARLAQERLRLIP
jgi:tol-pal system protein YbgF